MREREREREREQKKGKRKKRMKKKPDLVHFNNMKSIEREEERREIK